MAAGDRAAADEAPSAATAAGDRRTADAAPAACVPLGIHGDDAGVRSGGKEKILVLTWGAVAGKQNTLDSRLLFTSVKLSETPCVREVYRVLVWSMQVLFRGVYPDADHTGRPWPPGSWRAEQAGKPLALVGGKIWSGCWRELRGDWKWLKESLELERHYGTPGNMCHLRLPQSNAPRAVTARPGSPAAGGKGREEGRGRSGRAEGREGGREGWREQGREGESQGDD
jgi:hypothetical protein